MMNNLSIDCFNIVYHMNQRLTKNELERLKLLLKLDGLTALDLTDQEPTDFKGYTRLSFQWLNKLGKHGIVWSKPNGEYELIVDNNLGRLVGEIWIYKLDRNFTLIDRSILLMR